MYPGGVNTGKAPIAQDTQHRPGGIQLQTGHVKANQGTGNTKAFETGAYSAGLTADAAAQFASSFPVMWRPVIRALAQFENAIEYGLALELGGKPGAMSVTMKAALNGANAFIIASDGVLRLQCDVGFIADPKHPKAVGCVETRISAQQAVGYKAPNSRLPHSHELALSASRAEFQAGVHFMEMASHITHVEGNRYATSTIYTDPIIYEGEHVYQGKSGLIYLQGDRIDIKEHIRLGGLLPPNLLSSLALILKHIHNDGFAHGSLMDNIVVVLGHTGDMHLFVRASPMAKKMGESDFSKTVQLDCEHLRSIFYHAAGIQHDHAAKQPNENDTNNNETMKKALQQVNVYTHLAWNYMYQDLFQRHQANRDKYTAVTALARQLAAAEATISVEVANEAEAAARIPAVKRLSSLVLRNPSWSQGEIPEWFHYLLQHDPQTLGKLFDGAGLDRRSLTSTGPGGVRQSHASDSSNDLPIQTPPSQESDDQPFLPIMGNSAYP